METIVDRQAFWIMGSKANLLEYLSALCRDYGPNTPLVDLLRLLRQ